MMEKNSKRENMKMQ